MSSTVALACVRVWGGFFLVSFLGKQLGILPTCLLGRGGGGGAFQAVFFSSRSGALVHMTSSPKKSIIRLVALILVPGLKKKLGSNVPAPARSIFHRRPRAACGRLGASKLTRKRRWRNKTTLNQICLEPPVPTKPAVPAEPATPANKAHATSKWESGFVSWLGRQVPR